VVKRIVLGAELEEELRLDARVQDDAGADGVAVAWFAATLGLVAVRVGDAEASNGSRPRPTALRSFFSRNSEIISSRSLSSV
jgi:hypothetical protein